jgi:hypothetical protein
MELPNTHRETQTHAHTKTKKKKKKEKKRRCNDNQQTQSLTPVRIKDCTLRVSNKTAILFLYE